MIDWIIWYDDGGSFTNLQGSFYEAPRWGVICIVAYSRDHGRVIWHGTDYYVYDIAWISCDFVGLIDYLTRPGKEKTVLIGRHVQPAIFDKVFKMASQDPRMPPKSSDHHIERLYSK